MDDADGANRRRAERIGTEGLLRAQLAMEAEVLTISSRGMMVRLAFAPEIGSHHSFTLSFGAQTMAVLGTVRNVDLRETGERSFFEVGVEFEGIGTREEESLERFVTSKLEASGPF